MKNMSTYVDFLKDPPNSFFCGSRDHLNENDTIITYDKIFYSRTNIEGAIGMDPSSGTYTSDFPGTYSVTWSTFIANYYTDYFVQINLLKNGEPIRESYTPSRYT